VFDLHLLSEIHCEFNTPSTVAHLDIMAILDSVNRHALPKALRSRSISEDVFNSLTAVPHENTGAVSCVGINKSAHL